MPGITYTVGVSVQQFLNGMQRVAGAANTAKTAVVSAGGAMAAGLGKVGDVLFKLPQQVQAVSGILRGLRLPMGLAGSAETTAVAFRVLVGDAGKAESVLGRLKALAASTPFEFPELAGAARSLAAFGEDASGIPDVLKRIGDIASGTNTAIGDLAEIYGKARVAGTLYAEDINQLVGRGIPVIQEFAKQMGVAESQVKKMAADGQITFPMLQQAFSDLTGQGGKFSGMMTEISGTFEGKLSTLSDSIKGLLEKMGSGINEGIKPVMDELTRQLDGQQGLAKSIGESIGQGIEVGLEVIRTGEHWQVLSTGLEAAALNFGAALVKAVSSAVPGVLDGLSGVGAEILGAIPGVDKEALKGYVQSGSDSFSDWYGSDPNMGSDYLNRRASESAQRFRNTISGAEGRVAGRKEASRFDNENAAGRDAFARKQASEQQAQARNAAEKAQQAADVAAFATPGAASGRMWYDDEGKASDAKTAADKKAEVDAMYQQLYGTPAGSSQDTRGGTANQMGAAVAMPQQMAQEAAAEDAPGGRIKGVILPGSYQWKNGRKVAAAPSAASMDGATGRSQERQERGRESAGASRKAEGGDQREQLRDAVLKKLLKSVEEIERQMRQQSAQTVT